MRAPKLPAAAAAMAGLVALTSAAPAQAQPYYEFAGDPYVDGYYAPEPAGYYGRSGYGPADPCKREAGNRALGWGLVGLLLGGLAGGAAAGAGVVAEGAGLGGLVGGVTGALAGSASAACGSARYSGLPVYGSTRGGVAVYGPPRPIYDYGSAYAKPYAPHYYGGGYYERRGYERDYEDCCYEDRREYAYREEYHDDYAERRYDYPDYDDYREPRN